MAAPPPEPRVHRVVLGVEPGGVNAAALDLALVLSRVLGVELIGRVIEDIALRRVAQWTSAREIVAATGTSRPFDADVLERSLVGRMASLRDLLARRAGEHGVAWSLSTMPGPGLESLVGTSERSDLLVLGRAGQEPWSEAVDRQHALILYADTRHLRRAETLATRLVEAAPRSLRHSILWTHLHWPPTSAQLASLRRRRPAMVLLPLDISSGDAGHVRELLKVLNGPVLVLPP